LHANRRKGSDGISPKKTHLERTLDRACPITYPATLEVKLFAGKPGRTSFPTYSEIWNAVSVPEKVAAGDAQARALDAAAFDRAMSRA
jgi:hypothetical protein